MKYADFLSIKQIENDGNVFVFEVKEQHLNSHGTVHGGILYGICAESAAKYVHKTEGREGVGAEGSIHYYRPANEGDILYITVNPRKSGKRLSIYLTEVTDSNGKLIADMMFTVAH